MYYWNYKQVDSDTCIMENTLEKNKNMNFCLQCYP